MPHIILLAPRVRLRPVPEVEQPTPRSLLSCCGGSGGALQPTSMTTTPPPCGGIPRVAPLDELVDRDKTHDCGGFGAARVCVRVEAVADLPSRFGRFRIVAF